ncbi:MAG TPA: Uma2 family endonuclease [Pirellulales bacterium]|nr:Uma2 family endonuclease [Pirellulales bacterium]
MAQAPDAAELTVADMLERFGPIPARRIRHDPRPGTATEQDVVELSLHEDRLYELVDGILVEKTMGAYESYLGCLLSHFLTGHVLEHGLGIVLGADGMVRLAPGLVRIPDVSFISWDRFPRRQIPRNPILGLAPDLAIEVLSKGNTKQEMARKLEDYFTSGVRLVWYLDSKTATAQCYTSPKSETIVHANESLDGGLVLPGFRLPIASLFEEPKAP